MNPFRLFDQGFSTMDRMSFEDGGRLAPGDFFDEAGLLAGMSEACTLEALTRVTAYETDQHAFAPLLINRATMAEDLAQSLLRLPLPARSAQQQSFQHERHARVSRKAIEKVNDGGLSHALKH